MKTHPGENNPPAVIGRPDHPVTVTLMNCSRIGECGLKEERKPGVCKNGHIAHSGMKDAQGKAQSPYRYADVEWGEAGMENCTSDFVLS